MAPSRAINTATTFICASCRRQRSLPIASATRAFTTTTPHHADDTLPHTRTDSALYGLGNLSNQLRQSPTSSTDFSDILDTPSTTFLPDFDSLRRPSRDAAHRLHVLATKHNTHITFVQPAKAASATTSSGISATNSSAADKRKVVDVLLSLSTGNIGFTKAGRGSYDAAYQLAAFVLKQIQEKGMLGDIDKLEVVLRGFGAGREAVTKALLGSEGRNVRERISAVVDATRLKFGGSRSKKPRRLG